MYDWVGLQAMATQPFPRQPLDLDPQCRAMHAMIDGQNGNAVGSRLAEQFRYALLEGQRREAILGIHLDDGGRRILDHRHGVRHHSAIVQRRDEPHQAIEPMGATTVHFRRHQRITHGSDVWLTEAMMAQHLVT